MLTIPLPRFPWLMIWAGGFILLATANTLYAYRDREKLISLMVSESNAQ